MVARTLTYEMASMSLRLTRRAMTGVLAGSAAFLATGSGRRLLAQDATADAVPLSDDAFNQVAVATALDPGTFPLDATPDPDGMTCLPCAGVRR
jgi:hypothetical protein